MIVTLTMNPAIDKTAEVDQVRPQKLNRLENVMMDAGGKGINVSKTVQALGKESIAHGIVAGSNGAFIQSELDRLGIQHDFVEIEGNTRTNLKIVDAERELTELNESGPVPNAEELAQVRSKLLSGLHENDILVISGSVPKGVPTNTYYDLVLAGKSKQAKVILDADGDLFKEGIQAIPHLIKPNRYELCQYFHEDEDQIDDAMMIRLARQFTSQGVELVAISMGGDGALFVSEKEAIRVPALKIQAHSSVGAGDAMVAAMACALDDGLSLKALIDLAIATSAGAVMTLGTKPPQKELVKELMKQVVQETIE